MNKRTFEKLQKDKLAQLDKVYNEYYRLTSFCNVSKNFANVWSIEDYNCYWSWYYHSNLNAYEALDKLRD